MGNVCVYKFVSSHLYLAVSVPVSFRFNVQHFYGSHRLKH